MFIPVAPPLPAPIATRRRKRTRHHPAPSAHHGGKQSAGQAFAGVLPASQYQYGYIPHSPN